VTRIDPNILTLQELVYFSWVKIPYHFLIQVISFVFRVNKNHI